MDFWVSAELEGDDILDYFLKINNLVTKIMKHELASKSYDIYLDSWDCIAIIRNDVDRDGVVFDEITKYSPKKRDMDFRLKIDYDKFEAGTDHDRETLFFEMLLRSLNILKEKKGIGSGINELIYDVEKIGKEYNWI